MKRLFALRTLALVAAAFAAPLAFAHPGHGVAGGASGFVHPFAELDHLLAILAIEVAGQPLAVWLAGLILATALLYAAGYAGALALRATALRRAAAAAGGAIAGA